MLKLKVKEVFCDIRNVQKILSIKVDCNFSQTLLVAEIQPAEVGVSPAVTKGGLGTVKIIKCLDC